MNLFIPITVKFSHLNINLIKKVRRLLIQRIWSNERVGSFASTYNLAPSHTLVRNVITRNCLILIYQVTISTEVVKHRFYLSDIPSKNAVSFNECLVLTHILKSHVSRNPLFFFLFHDTVGV